MSTSAPAVNSVTLVGRLTADPILRELPDGRAVCDMRLAVNDQRDQPPLFIDVATFGAAAAACEKYLANRRQIALTGRLIYREWQAPDGTRRRKHAVIGRVRFGGRHDDHGADDDADSVQNGDDDIEF